MSTFDLFTLILGSLTLAAAVMVVLSRNAMHAASYLLLTMLGVVIEFALLRASFLAIFQLLVYAVAIVILMVLGPLMFGVEYKESRPKGAGIVLPVLFAAVLLVAGGISLVTGNPLRVKPPPTQASAQQTAPKKPGKVATRPLKQPVIQENFGTMQAVSEHLFTQNLLAFELLSVLLMIAMAGMIVLLREPQAKDSADPPPTSDEATAS